MEAEREPNDALIQVIVPSKAEIKQTLLETVDAGTREDMGLHWKEYLLKVVCS